MLSKSDVEEYFSTTLNGGKVVSIRIDILKIFFDTQNLV